MTTKEKYEMIDKSKVGEKLLTILQNMEKSSKNFTDESVNSKIDTALDKIIEGFRASKPEALRSVTEAKKEVKKEKEKAIKKNEGKDFSDKKDTDDKTGLPKKDTLEERKDIIKKESESEKEAKERAKKELEKEKEKAKEEIESQIDKLNRLILEDPALRGFNTGTAATGGGKSTPLIDAERKALPRGSRVSKKGWKNQYGASEGGRKYWENRENRSDRKSPDYETGKPYLEKGGNVYSSDDMYEVKMVQDGIELDSKLIRARNKGEARMIFEDMYLDKYQDEFGEFEIKIELAKNNMSRGGGIAFKNFGKTKGRFNLTYEDDGEKQSEIWSSLEEATSSARRYSSPKLGYTNIHIYDETGKEYFFANGGKLNTEVILTENRSNGAKWRGVVKPFMMKSIEKNQFSGGFKRYEIDIYDDEVQREPSKEELKQANEFFDKVGGRFSEGGETEDERLSMGESIYFEVFNDDGKDGIIKFRNDGSNIIEALIAGDIRGFRPKRYMSYLTKKDLERYLNRDFDSVEEVDEEYVQNILSQEAKNKPSDIKVVKFPYPEIASSPEVVTIIKKGDQVFDYNPIDGTFSIVFTSLSYDDVNLDEFLEDSKKLSLDKLSPEILQVIEVVKENNDLDSIGDELKDKGLIKNYVQLAKGGYIVSQADEDGYVYILDADGKKVSDSKIPSDIGYGKVKNKFVAKKRKYDPEMGKYEAMDIVERMNTAYAKGGYMPDGGKTGKKKFTSYTILDADEYGNRDSSSKKKPTKFYIVWYGNSYQLFMDKPSTINNRAIFDNDDEFKKAIDKVRYSTPTYVNYGLPQDQKFYKEFIISEKFEYAKGGYMADGGVVSTRQLNKKIKDWYIKTYPTDDLGEEINDKITFKEFWAYLNQGYDVYDVLEVYDSLVRERVFEKVSDIYGVDYDDVYEKWLPSNNYAKGGAIDVNNLQDLIGQKALIQKSDYSQYTGKIIDIEEFKMDVNLGNGIGGYESTIYATIIDEEDGKKKHGVLKEIIDKMAKGGYMAKGENYEYINNFTRFDSNVPVDDDDFEKFVDAYHKKLSGDRLDEIKYELLKERMGNYLGHKTMDEMEAYVEKTHQAHNKMDKGGYMADGGDVIHFVAIPEYMKEVIAKGVNMGYDTIVEGMITPKKRGIMIINDDYKVRGTFDMELKDAIQNIIDKVKSGEIKVEKEYAEGGDIDDESTQRFDKMRSAFELLDIKVKSRIVEAVGIDNAQHLFGDYSVSPLDLITRAVRRGLLELDEINQDLFWSAVMEAERVTEHYRDSGEGIGSSDITYFTKAMLDDAGYKTGFVNNRLERLDENGNVLQINEYKMDY